MRKKFLVLCIFLIICLKATSQETGSCAENLKNAQMLFAKGQVEQVPNLCKGCLSSGFTREEALDAYKLLIQTYLLEDRLEQADSLMLAFLKKNPEYEVSPTDHSSFVSLFNNFSSKIVLQTSLHIGSNIPFVIVTSHNSVMGTPGEKDYSTEAFNLFQMVKC
jgi:predicted RNase H-like HicB family nuclease